MDIFNIHEKAVNEYGEYRTQRLILEAIDAGLLLGDHPDPDPSVVGPNARPSTAIKVENSPADHSTPPKQQEKSRPSAKGKKTAPAKQAEQLTMPQFQLPDLSLASEGTFSQRLKRVQKLGKQSSTSSTLELVIYLTAPVRSLRLLAMSFLTKRNNLQTVAALKALFEQEDIPSGTRRELLRILKHLMDESEGDDAARIAARSILGGIE